MVKMIREGRKLGEKQPSVGEEAGICKV